MPNIKSAKKRVKVISTKTMQNRAVNSQLKTEIKKANAAIEGNAENKADAVRVAVKKIDQAVAKGILHKNTAAERSQPSTRSCTPAPRACLKIEEVPEFLFQRERFQGGNRKKYFRISRVSNTGKRPFGAKRRCLRFFEQALKGGFPNYKAIRLGTCNGYRPFCFLWAFFPFPLLGEYLLPPYQQQQHPKAAAQQGGVQPCCQKGRADAGGYAEKGAPKGRFLLHPPVFHVAQQGGQGAAGEIGQVHASGPKLAEALRQGQPQHQQRAASYAKAGEESCKGACQQREKPVHSASTALTPP